jgi:hypothetical protein
MSSTKMPISTSYRAVFALSILMIFLVIVGGAMSGSKSVGFGIWYWGYTAWKMYKRDNDSLVSLQRIMLWFQAVAFSVALAVLLFSDADVRRYVDVAPIVLMIIATVSLGVTYALYKFFRRQISTQGGKTYIPESLDKVSDKYWEQALNELESTRHEATWAKSVSAAEGDKSKAKAFYLKMRATALQNIENESNQIFANISVETNPNNLEHGAGIIKRYVFVFAFVVIGVVVAYFAYHDHKKSATEIVEGDFSYDDHKKSATEIVDGVTRKKFPLFRQLSDGSSVRWNRDTECFIKMTLDFSNAVSPVFLSRTSNNSSPRYKELTQEERLIAVVFYDVSVSDEVITKYINKETFQSLKAMCEVQF